MNYYARQKDGYWEVYQCPENEIIRCHLREDQAFALVRRLRETKSSIEKGA